MRRRPVRIVIAFGVGVALITAASILAQTNGQAVLQPLEVAKVFAFGGVGFAGTTSQEELAFKSILVLPSDTAKQRLERLYSSGNPQAMSYALAGMRKLDRKRYAELIASARTSDATVHTMSGCIMTNEKLRKIADELDWGKYDPWLR